MQCALTSPEVLGESTGSMTAGENTLEWQEATTGTLHTSILRALEDE